MKVNVCDRCLKVVEEDIERLGVGLSVNGMSLRAWYSDAAASFCYACVQGFKQSLSDAVAPILQRYDIKPRALKIAVTREPEPQPEPQPDPPKGSYPEPKRCPHCGSSHALSRIQDWFAVSGGEPDTRIGEWACKDCDGRFWVAASGSCWT